MEIMDPARDKRNYYGLAIRQRSSERWSDWETGRIAKESLRQKIWLQEARNTKKKA